MSGSWLNRILRLTNEHALREHVFISFVLWNSAVHLEIIGNPVRESALEVRWSTFADRQLETAFRLTTSRVLPSHKRTMSSIQEVLNCLQDSGGLANANPPVFFEPRLSSRNSCFFSRTAGKRPVHHEHHQKQYGLKDREIPRPVREKIHH